MIILSDKSFRENLFPFTHTRHSADIRIGILTIREKWQMLTGEQICTDENETGIFIPANIIPTQENFELVLSNAKKDVSTQESAVVKIIKYPWHIFQHNDFALRHDFAMLTNGRKSQTLPEGNRAVNPENIFIEPGAKISCSILNADTGPIYIGADAEIMEGNMIRGPFSLGAGSVLKMGSKIYGATTIGPHCVAGGEIKNSVLFANSNKAHDGYLGDSVLGEWCNLGAGTSNSNVKNTGGNIGYKLTNHSETVNAGNKAGLLMGDFSRSAINTSFNTGSVVGVCCNIFGEKMPDKYTENFTWGNERYIFEKALADIENWKKMKHDILTEPEIKNLLELYDRN